MVRRLATGWGVVGAVTFSALLLTLLVPRFSAERTEPMSQLSGQTVELSARQALASPLRRLVFESNRGQADPSIRYLARGDGYNLLLYPRGMTLDLRAAHAAGPARLRLSFVGAAAVEPVAEEPLASCSNYFLGDDPAAWRTNVPHHGRVRYEGIYPGVDLVFAGHQGLLKFDLELAPGADPDRLAMRVDGASAMRVDDSGDLVLTVPGGEVRKPKPVIYQLRGERRVPVDGGYELADGLVRFRLGDYDRRRPLVIDPTLDYSSYLGGNEQNATNPDTGYAIGVDDTGAIYVCGYTTANNFPTQQPGQAYAGAVDGFITKLDASGANLVYSTYLGGSGDDFLGDLAVTGDGRVFVTGVTTSTNFPVANAIQATGGGSQDAVITGLGTSGNTLAFSTYYGGSNTDGGRYVGLDAAGNVYASGFTKSTNLTINGGFQTANAGGTDRFVVKLAGTSGALQYSTYLGGTNEDGSAVVSISGTSDRHTGDMAVDAAGNVYLTDFTQSTDFPLVNAIQATPAGAKDLFISKIDTTGANLVYSTYLGGSGDDDPFGIAVDSFGRAWVAGPTSSDNFPTAGAPYQSTPGAAFLARLAASGQVLEYGSYLLADAAAFRFNVGRVALDVAGNVYVAGFEAAGFVPEVNPIQSGNAGANDGFLLQFGPSGSNLLFGTYFGGTGADTICDVAWRAGKTYLVGYTRSTNFPTQSPRQAAIVGTQDAFVAVISEPFPLPDLQIKERAQSSLVGDDIYNNDGTNQTATGQAVPATGAVYHLRVQNDGNVADTINVTGTAGQNGWTVQYFDAWTGGNEITGSVTGAGFPVAGLAADATVDLRAVVTPAAAVPVNSTFDLLVTGTSAANGNRLDTVKATTTRVLGPQLNFLGQTGYTSDGVEPNSGTIQTTFAFRALYTNDLGRNALFVRLHLLRNGQAITDSPFAMTATGSDPFSGIIYSADISGLVKGGAYTYRMEASDGVFVAGGPLIAELAGPTVVNAPPTATGLALVPAAPLADQDVRIDYTYTDADGDPESGTQIAWTINGSAVSGLANPRILPAARTNMGDTINVVVTPKDGVDSGSPAAPAAPAVVQQRNLALTSVGTTGVQGKPLTVTGTLTNGSGSPVAGELIRFATGNGTIADPAVLTNAAGQASTQVTLGVGAVPITATSGGATANVAVTGRAPATTGLSVEIVNPTADQTTTLVAKVISTTSGLPIPGQAVTSTVVQGEANPRTVTAVSDPMGEARLNHVFPLGAHEVTITAGDASQTLTVTTGAGSIARQKSTVTLGAERLPADGVTTIPITVTLRDGSGANNGLGNPVAGVPGDNFRVTGSPNLGVEGRFTASDQQGVARGTLTARFAGATTLTVKVVDPKNNQLTTLTDTLALQVQSVFMMQLEPGLNLVGVPVVIGDPSPLRVWQNVRPLKVARYVPESGGYLSLNPIQPTADFDVTSGRAFWIKVSTPTQVQISGDPGTTTTWTVPLNSQEWTLASIPTPNALAFRHDVLRVTINDQPLGTLAASADFVEPYVWIWDSGRQQYRVVIDPEISGGQAADTIPAGSGFWLKRGSENVGGGQLGLVFDVQQLARRGRSGAGAPPSAANWSLALNVAAPGVSGDEATIGVSSRLGRQLVIARPPAAEGAGLRLDLLDDTGRASAGILDPEPVTNVGREYRLRVVHGEVTGPVTVSWPAANRSVPAGYRLVLSDPTSGRSVSLRSKASYEYLATGDSRELSLRLERDNGQRLTVGLNAQPSSRSRGANLAITLNQPAELHVRVLGMNGRAVKQWTVGQVAAGTAPVSWDGTDADGRRVPAGTYRLEAWAEDELGEVASATAVILVR